MNYEERKNTMITLSFLKCHKIILNNHIFLMKMLIISLNCMYCDGESRYKNNFHTKCV